MASLKERATYRQSTVRWTRESTPSGQWSHRSSPVSPRGWRCQRQGKNMPLCVLHNYSWRWLLRTTWLVSVDLRPLPYTVKLVKMAYVMFCVFYHKQWEWLKGLGRITPIIGCLLWGFIFILYIQGGLACEYVHVPRSHVVPMEVRR